MLKNLFINRKNLKKVEEKNLVIYRAPIMRMYINDLRVVNNEITSKINSSKARQNSLFYPTSNGYVNLEYKCILPKEDIVKEKIENYLAKNENYIKGILLNPNCTHDKKIALIDHMSEITSYLYYDPDLMEPAQVISESEFQKIKVPIPEKNPIFF